MGSPTEEISQFIWAFGIDISLSMIMMMMMIKILTVIIIMSIIITCGPLQSSEIPLQQGVSRVRRTDRHPSSAYILKANQLDFQPKKLAEKVHKSRRQM